VASAVVVEPQRTATFRDRQLTAYNGIQYLSASNPVFVPSKPTKILVSPGTGAGWVSYAPRTATDAFLVWMLTYEPLIRALEVKARKGR
jgi:hypothetical protein